MFTGLNNRLQRARIKRVALKLNSLGPLQKDPSPEDFEIVSLVSSNDVPFYLLAIRSFVKYGASTSHITVINDGSLKSDDIHFIRQHIPFVEFIHINDIDTGKCPSGSCWERLIHIIGKSSRRYVIQMDSDTLTLKNIPEIASAITENRAFILGTHRFTELASKAESASYANAVSSNHIQIITERALDKIAWSGENYIRGSAGFAGFPKNTISKSDAEKFSSAVISHIGPQKWLEWGSEQVTSNALLANTPDPLILKEPYFVNHGPDSDLSLAKFVHFIGYARFKHHNYLKLSKIAAGKLMAPL